jgi:hypothetical protein
MCISRLALYVLPGICICMRVSYTRSGKKYVKAVSCCFCFLQKLENHFEAYVYESFGRPDLIKFAAEIVHDAMALIT